MLVEILNPNILPNKIEKVETLAQTASGKKLRIYITGKTIAETVYDEKGLSKKKCCLVVVNYVTGRMKTTE